MDPKPEKFVKRPVEIEAVRYDGGPESRDAVLRWMGEGAIDSMQLSKPGGPSALVIHTLEGTLNASPGDWIIKGVKGEFYPCKPDVFERTHRRITARPPFVMQRFLHDPSAGVTGDCTAASLATLLGVPYEEVPDTRGLKAGEWQRRVNDWLAKYGLCYVEVELDATFAEPVRAIGIEGLWTTLSGPSPRFKGCEHMAVGVDGVVELDPHPAAVPGAELERITAFGLVVALRPWELAS